MSTRCAGATNQAIKAIAITRNELREEGADSVCQPAFIGVAIDDETRTAICLYVTKR
jgi:stage V sporulation protein S